MALEANASTARTLNLVAVWKRHAQGAEYRAKPFFNSVVLNRAIIVKHRLRANERESFDVERTSATKIILPIDPMDMRSGARSFFIRQKGFQTFLDEVSHSDETFAARDVTLLHVLDALPSLDPFLMRERLKKGGFEPATCYFDVTENDATRMFKFVQMEMRPLVGLLFSPKDPRINEKSSHLARKILANSADAELNPLREGMGMSKADFEEGVFCWKGFIYYKWTLADLMPLVRPVLAELEALKPVGPATDEQKIYIAATRTKLTKSLTRACEAVKTTLTVYDDAYGDLTRNGKPHAFRDFLMNAPTMFYEIGERLGAVQHVVSYWRFRFPQGSKFKLQADDTCDLLADFESSISFEKTPATAPPL